MPISYSSKQSPEHKQDDKIPVIKNAQAETSKDLETLSVLGSTRNGPQRPNLTPQNALLMQRTYGNQAVMRLVRQKQQVTHQGAAAPVQRVVSLEGFNSNTVLDNLLFSDTRLKGIKKALKNYDEASDIVEKVHLLKNIVDECGKYGSGRNQSAVATLSLEAQMEIGKLRAEYNKSFTEGRLKPHYELLDFYEKNVANGEGEIKEADDFIRPVTDLLLNTDIGKIVTYRVFWDGYKARKDDDENISRKTLRYYMQDLVHQVRTEIYKQNSLFNQVFDKRGEEAPTAAKLFQNKNVEPTSFTDANIEPDTAPKMLGSGAVNSVYEVNFVGSEPKVFKSDKEGNSIYDKDSGTKVGIPEDNPEYAKRAVAMYKLDQLLNAGVIPATDFAVVGGAFGTVMDKVKGKSGNKHEASEEDEVFKRTLSRLQLLDVLAGQVDRHGENYMVEQDDKGQTTGVKGIDNDMAFGAEHTDVTDTSLMGKSTPLSHIPHFDPAFVQVIMQVEPDTVKQALDGLLKEDEINATLDRLAGLKQYLQENVIDQPDK